MKAESEKPVKVRYAWVELSPNERSYLGLQNAAEGGLLWGQLAELRRPDSKAKVYVHNAGDEGKASSMALFSWEVDPASPLAREEAENAIRAVRDPKWPEDKRLPA